MPPPGIAGSRILVTGARGFIGTALTERLRSMGAEVHALSRTPDGGHTGRGRHSDTRNTRETSDIEDGHIHWWPADLENLDRTKEVLAEIQPQVVMHLAGHVSGDRSLASVDASLRGNLVATVNLLTAACEAGRPRVVLAGSMEEQGDDEACPGSPYAAAKTAAAQYGWMYHALYDLPVVHLRVFMVYGPGPQDATKLVPYVTRSLLRGEPPLLSSGDRDVDWVYIDDVVDAFVAAATAPRAVGATVDVGSGELVSIRALVKQLTRLVGDGISPQFGALADRPLERPRTANLAPAKELLGWMPETPLPNGLGNTVAWFRKRPE